MDENPFGGDEDDLAPKIVNKNTEEEGVEEGKRIIGEKTTTTTKTEEVTSSITEQPNKIPSSSTKKTSLWGDEDDEKDVQIEKATMSKRTSGTGGEGGGGEGVKKKNFFGDEDDDSATTNVMSSFLPSKNDGPMSQMASYHEQTSYSFHGGSGNDEMASPLAAFETVIPGSKTALLREQELAASSSAQKKKEEEEDTTTYNNNSNEPARERSEFRQGNMNNDRKQVEDEIVEIQLGDDDDATHSQQQHGVAEQFDSPFNKPEAPPASTTSDPPPPSYQDSVMYANPAIQPGNSMMMNSSAPAVMRAEQTFEASSMQQQQQQQQQQPQYYQTAPPPPTLPQQTFNRHELSGALSPSFQFYPPYDPAKDETLVSLGDEKKTELVAYITEAKTEPEFNQQGGPGLSKKVTRYKINFKTNSDKFMQKEAIVWRRFSDFVQLHDRLLESHRGYFIPPRPEKSIKRLGDEAFVQARKLTLQNYLEKLIKHPSLRTSMALKVFLTQQDLQQSREWHALAVPAAASSTMMSSPAGYQHQEQQQQQQQQHHHQETLQPSTPSMQFAPDSHMMASSPIGGVNPASPGGAANGGSAIFTQQNVSASSMMTSPSATSPATPNRSSVGKFFRELRQSMATSSAVAAVGGAFGIEAAKPKIVEEDAKFLVDKEKSTKLETELCGLSLKTEKILQREEKFADSLGAFGLECMKFARVEEEASGISGRYSEPGTRLATAAQFFRKVGNASVRASRIARAATVQLAKAMDPLHAHLNLMPSVRRATQLRADTLLSLQTLLSDQERLTNRINKLAPDITKHVKIEQLKRELEETNRLAENAKREYDCIRARQANEFARSEKERVEEFEQMLLGLARVQVAQAERTLSVWRSLAEELGASPQEWSQTISVEESPPEKEAVNNSE